MAVYMVYAPPARTCPLTFGNSDFWKNPDTFTLAVKNTSAKPIASVALTSEMFLAPLDLRRPFNAQWASSKPILPGQEQMLEKPGIRAASAQAVMGWVFFPSSVKFEDGTTWLPQSEGECFHIFWRDPGHPDMPVLPPRQIEMNPD